MQLVTESGTHLILTAVGRLKRFKLLLMVEYSILRLYRPGQPNWEYKMWKFQDFSAIHISREIDFGHCDASKTAIFTI